MQVLFITNTKYIFYKEIYVFFSQALLLRLILVGNLLMEAMLNQQYWFLEKTKSNICRWVPISMEKSKHSLLPTPISLRTYLDLWPRVWKLSLRYTYIIFTDTGYSFWEWLRNFWCKFTWIVLSVHKLNKLGKFW